MSSRAFPIPPQESRPLRAEVYTQSNAKPTKFTPLFSAIWALLATKTRTAAGFYLKKCGPFPVVSSRY
jgi:hypothetical protein